MYKHSFNIGTEISFYIQCQLRMILIINIILVQRDEHHGCNINIFHHCIKIYCISIYCLAYDIEFDNKI